MPASTAGIIDMGQRRLAGKPMSDVVDDDDDIVPSVCIKTYEGDNRGNHNRWKNILQLSASPSSPSNVWGVQKCLLSILPNSKLGCGNPLSSLELGKGKKGRMDLAGVIVVVVVFVSDKGEGDCKGNHAPFLFFHIGLHLSLSQS